MKEKVLVAIIVLLVLLFSYTAVSKLADMATFTRELRSQPYGHYWASYGKWIIPLTELFTALLLISTNLRGVGLWASMILMSVFTIYVFLILIHVFPKKPCSCAGVFRNMGWFTHFLFNLAFTALAAIGIRSNNSFLNQKHVS